MKAAALKHSICSVERGAGKTFGGSQMLSENTNIKKYGCGIVAAADLLYYINRYHKAMDHPLLNEMAQGDSVSLDIYRRFLVELNRRYLPIIPTRGINCVMLAGGLNIFLRRYGVKMTAQWCFSGDKLWNRCEDMLLRDLPVIISVGPNFPKVWGRERLKMYTMFTDGSLRPTGSVKAHFMTVTAMDDEWICVSSWGRRFFISKAEFEAYVHKYSGSVICNIVYIK